MFAQGHRSGTTPEWKKCSNRHARGYDNSCARFFRKIGSIPSGPFEESDLRFFNALKIKEGLNTMLLNSKILFGIKSRWGKTLLSVVNREPK